MDHLIVFILDDNDNSAMNTFNSCVQDSKLLREGGVLSHARATAKTVMHWEKRQRAVQTCLALYYNYIIIFVLNCPKNKSEILVINSVHIQCLEQ